MITYVTIAISGRSNFKFKLKSKPVAPVRLRLSLGVAERDFNTPVFASVTNGVGSVSRMQTQTHPAFASLNGRKSSVSLYRPKAEAPAREHQANGEGDLSVNEVDEDETIQYEDTAGKGNPEQLDGVMSSVGTNPTPTSPEKTWTKRREDVTREVAAHCENPWTRVGLRMGVHVRVRVSIAPH